MPPLNTTLIRGCSELQGPATHEWLWHGSDVVAPSLCSLLGPITPHLSCLLFLSWALLMEAMDESLASNAVRRRWTRSPFQLRRCVKCCLTGGGLKTLARGHLAPDGPGKHTELSPHYGAKAHAFLHIICLAEDFWGCFYICSTSCLSHLVVNSEIQNYVADFLVIFFFFKPCTLFALACYPLT